MKASAAVATIVAALSLWACGDDGDSPAGGQSAGPGYSGSAAKPRAQQGGDKTAAAKRGETARPRASGVSITTADSDYGEILFDGDDRAIYLFDKETSPASECYGACADAWPPVLTKGAPQARAGAKASLLGTTRRDDGSTQVTYKGHPLYYYVDDPPGEVLCHDVVEFGGLWLVVQPGGDPVS